MIIACWAVIMLLSFSACSGGKKKLGAAITERDSLPVLDTRGITMLISDSGVTRYRIKTDLWLIYDRKSPSYWAFEKGLYLEKFDSVFHVEASIKSDTAYYYDKQRLWKLMGHVVIKNIKGEKFKTQLLYWDENSRKVYSDKSIRIEQLDRIITGKGFESDQQMTVYTIHKPEGVFFVKDENKLGPDSVAKSK
jgi:LPS export ABC transporter protein LptC